MRRGFDQPTSSSTSRSSGTAPRDYTQRTRQGRNDAPVQANSISARRKSSNQPSLALPQQPTELQPASSGRKSPAYLEGKNPYGQILDNVDHPYRRPKATGGAPSQVGATSESRPRTSGSFSFKTRPEPKTEPEREATALNPSPAPLPPRMSAKPVSVRAAKDFFESKASQDGSASPLPPSRASAAAKGAIPKGAVSEKQVASLSRRRSKDEASRPARILSPPARSAVYPESDMEPCMPRPPPDPASQIEPAQRTNPFTRSKSDSLAPKLVLRKATTPLKSPVNDDLSLSDPSDPSNQKPRRRKSTNIFETAPRDAKPLGSELRAVDSSALDEASNAPRIALEHVDRSDGCFTSDEIVRRHITYDSVSAAESDEDATGDMPFSSAQARRTEFGRHVRRAFEDDIGSEVKRVRKRKYGSAPLTDQGPSITERIESKSRKSSATGIDKPSGSPSGGAPSSVLKRIAGVALNGFSNDGSSSTPSISRRSTAPGSEECLKSLSNDARVVASALFLATDRAYLPQTPYPYVPPKAAEKLNVGAPRQLALNLNDCESTLRESIKTVPDLVELVESAADDLGVDLNKLPTAKDDEAFRDAPVQGSSIVPAVSPHGLPEFVKETIVEEAELAEESWLEQIRRHLTGLAEAQYQLMDELDEIAEDLDVQARERFVSGPSFDPVQRILSKVSTGLSRTSMRLRNKSVDSVAEDIPRMIDQQINERRLSRILTRGSIHSRRMSAVTHGPSDIGEIAPEEIQEWLEVAQSKLPGAITSITAVLETLPALVLEPESEGVEGQSEDEPELGEPAVVYEDYLPSQHSYTEPIVELQNRVADRKRLFRQQQQKLQFTSSDYREDSSLAPIERVAASKTADFESLVVKMAEHEPVDETELELKPEALERIAARATTTSTPRMPIEALQTVGYRSPLLSSSSEL
ncbi:hypothetical protein N0V86_000792 [Didymella sp. IMI 355093]|nr:hypothetical protein N0V86_000792 [Didymella sp. IMI 355093]